MRNADARAPSASGAVLVLDADQASALAIVRSLGRRSIEVHAASHAESPLAGYSRHARQRLRYPDPMREEAGFLDWLTARLAEPTYDLVIPVTERSLVPMNRGRQRLDVSRIAMACETALEQVLDKDRTLSLARTLGIPAPTSIKVQSLEDAEAAVASLGLPVVVKPSRSMGSDGSAQVQLSVSYARDLRELRRQVQHALRFGDVVLQEWFQGDGVGVEVIADQGRIRCAFQHRRLHEVPLTGGGSSLRISEPVAPALRAASAQLMEALKWHGVAMVEFKHRPGTGEFRLMEINGRFWGSLPLAVAAGADFPYMLHELMCRGGVTEPAPARDGIVCRHLSRDIDWLEHVLRRAAPAGLARLPTWRQVARDTLLVLSPRHRFDVQSLSDIRPGLVDAGRIAQRQWRRIADAARMRRRLRSAVAAARPSGRGTQLMRRATSVLFVCYGNINRSALAHAHACARHPSRAKFASAGFHAEGGRPADPTMVSTAAAQGIDLRTWHSQPLTPALVAAAEVILVMELAHLDRLAREFPSAKDRVFLLGAPTAAATGKVEVIDPYGKPPEVYAQVCRQVIESVDAWLAESAAGGARA